MLTREELSPMIDHTNLNLDAIPAEIEELCQEALDYHFGAVCVRPDMVETAHGYIFEYMLIYGGDYAVNVASVVGFPTAKTTTVEEMIENLSQYTTADKVKEAEKAISVGVDEIDMVIDLGAMKSGNYVQVRDDIKAVVDMCGRHIESKVIIETGYLTHNEKLTACVIADAVGAGFVKTSTGFGVSGANASDLELMSGMVGSNVGIKASGGVHTVEQAISFYEATQKYRHHEFRVGASKLVGEYK